MSLPGLILSAAASGSGKTTVTLGLARALSRAGVDLRCCKSGPDYIDPAFHRAATGRASVNLDSWAMGRDRLAALIASEPAEMMLAEGSMGLFDGVAMPGEAGNGSSADLSALTGWPVLLVVDASGQAQTAAAVAAGLARFRPGVTVAGVILNRIASPRHEALVRAGFAEAGLPVLGVLPRAAEIALPERHLGLVQAGEIPALEALLDRLADLVEAHCDLAAIRALARRCILTSDAPLPPVPPPGMRIAIARDDAFSFTYPHLLADWRAAGATLLPFSPLAGEAPDPGADACWLPGGYPELHAGRLAAADGFRDGLRDFAQTRPVHGECGGYMTLGAGLVTADGTRHRMVGLLGLETSFARRKMHLGYRLAELHAPQPGLGARLRGHEFHYASILEMPDPPLARVSDATGAAVAETGSLRQMPGGGRVSGTFFHLIAPAGPQDGEAGE